LKHWKSYSLNIQDVNYFSYGNEENRLEAVEKLSVEYYEKLERIPKNLLRGKIRKDGDYTKYNTRWLESNPYKNFRKEVIYRVWFGEDFFDTLRETKFTLNDI
jgi:hypothetical protein